MRRIYDFHVRLVINVPNLRHKWLVGLDDTTDILFETADDHSVGHDEGERMVKLHVLIDSFEIFIFEEDTSSRVMALKTGDIQHVVIEYEQSLLSLLRVAFDFLVVFEFEISLFSFG